MLTEGIKRILALTTADVMLHILCGQKAEVEKILKIFSDAEVLQNSRVKLPYMQRCGDRFFSLPEWKRLLCSYGKTVRRPVHFYNACPFYVSDAYVIDCDLRLLSCPVEGKQVGHILPGGKVLYNEQVGEKIMYAVPDKKCRECILLPMCMGGCPYQRKQRADTCVMQMEELKDYILLCLEEKHK